MSETVDLDAVRCKIKNSRLLGIVPGERAMPFSEAALLAALSLFDVVGMATVGDKGALQMADEFAEQSTDDLVDTLVNRMFQMFADHYGLTADEGRLYDLSDPDFQRAVAERLAAGETLGQAAPPEPAFVPTWLRKRESHGGKPGRPDKYEFATMDVHGTFRIPPGNGAPKFNSLRIYAIKKGKELGRKFRCHQYPDGTIEVWRES